MLRLLFESSPAYKIFLDDTSQIVKQATSQQAATLRPNQTPNTKTPEVVNVDFQCEKCRTKYNLYAKFIDDEKIDKDMEKMKKSKIPSDGKLVCSNCGYENDLMGIINQIESEVGKKLLL